MKTTTKKKRQTKKMSTKKKVAIGAGVLAAIYVIPRLGGVMMFGPRALLPNGG